MVRDFAPSRVIMAPVARDPSRPSIAPEESMSPLPATKKQVLVVDDDLRLLRVLGMFLSIEGYEVISAPSGDAGVREAERLRPALIVMDIMMPGMDGITACSLIRANPVTADIPVLLFSALSGGDEVERARLAGANHLITKPYNLEGLGAVVSSLCALEGSLGR
jgi:CheY-like chemotaxis protein